MNIDEISGLIPSKRQQGIIHVHVILHSLTQTLLSQGYVGQ